MSQNTLDPETQQNIFRLGGKARKILSEALESGEPVFVFRAKDLLSVFALNAYARACEEMLSNDSEMAMDIVDQIEMFKQWQKAHPEKVKLPD